MNKPTLAAIGAFVVLLLAFFATREKAVSVGVKKFDVPAISTVAIESVTVTGANAAKLERGANGWTVADPAKADVKFPADDAQVQAVLSALAEFKAPDFVNDKADKHAEYEVTNDKGTTVAVSGGGKSFTVILGKASKGGGTYVRKTDGDAVFVTQSAATWQVKRNVTAWRKKTITTPALADVTQVDVVRADGETYWLKSDGTTWTLGSAAPAGFRFDGAAAQRLTTQLTSLTAQDFLSADGDFSKANVFTLTTKDGKTTKVTVAATKREDGNFALKVDGDAQQYVVATWIVEQLDKKLEGLRDLTLMAFDPTKVTKATITAAGKKTIVAKEGETWKLVEPKSSPEFDGSQVLVQLNKLKTFRAAKVVEKGALGAASTTVELVADGKPVKLVFGAESGGDVFVKGNADDLVYATTAAEKNSWGAGAALFNKPPPPPNFGNGGINGLDQLPPEIRQQLMQQLQQQQMQQRN